METLKLTPVASTVMEMFGPMPVDTLHEIEFDPEVATYLAHNLARKEFNRVSDPMSKSKGLELSRYFVDGETTDSVGYWGTYLN